MTATTASARGASALVLTAAVGLAVAGCTPPDSSLPQVQAPGSIVIPGAGWGAMRTFCDHGNRVYHALGQGYSGGGVAVVPADPSCAGGAS